MNWPQDSEILAFVAVFCRTGACLGFAPGFGSPRTPVRVRLLLCGALSAAIHPVGQMDALPGEASVLSIASIIAPEILLGAALGIGARVVVAALEMAGTTISMSFGLSSSFAPRIEESETLPDLASLLALAATMLIFATDIHWMFVEGLVDSFRIIPMGELADPAFVLRRLVEGLSYAFITEMRIAMPFITFGLMVGVATAIINRMVPQIPLYFLSTPATILGGLLLLRLFFEDTRFATILSAGFLK